MAYERTKTRENVLKLHIVSTRANNKMKKKCRVAYGLKKEQKLGRC